MIDLPPISAPVKRSVTINGHRTSVSLEDAFWTALKRAADRHQITRAALVSQIDHRRPPDVGLATALRLFVLAEAGDSAVREKAERPN
ncbi:ribbon-helix-helix domain-containing protein [Paracoccus sp. TK19116]|uniref:Ribbon-helix-helix domain-containing protein n=1 Tax=Paracoccus albicereus TaxID=2922394 RepID=A0ABT1MS81_9RHOB|nr:ribbon-helix-helix domain-containing protein [Paracoccus albicereus]MCQ0971157.1 ribbon-helix-helix domain-containing protein [Paracoccus albicereus]